MPYALYIGNKNYSSWSLRPWVMLRACDIDFEERLIPFDDGDSYDKFRDFSPTGLVPCLIDGDQQVWESLAIVEYIAEQHPEVWPESRAARAWARSAAAEMHAGFGDLRNDCPMTIGQRIRLHTVSAGLQKDLDRLDELWGQGLDRFGGPFLAGGQFTAVDAFFAPVAFRLNTFSRADGSALASPAADRYRDHLLDLSAMRSWYSDGIAETFREPSHELEIAELGICTEDMRAG
ncbi:MAG: glutathione S-transferase [Pseudomonadota bacterium]